MGYLLVDNKVSGGMKQEYDTKSCKHCQGIVKVLIKRHLLGGQSKKKDEGFFCIKCMGPLCEYCAVLAHKNGCAPFMDMLIKKMREKQQKRRLTEMLEGGK